MSEIGVEVLGKLATLFLPYIIVTSGALVYQSHVEKKLLGILSFYRGNQLPYTRSIKDNCELALIKCREYMSAIINAAISLFYLLTFFSVVALILEHYQDQGGLMRLLLI